MIRWKFFIPTLIVLLLGFLFFVFAFDALLTRGLEKVGAKANGAKVDVVGLKTKFFQGRLTIKNIQVADRKDPMRNRVELGPIAVQLNLLEILKKNVIIPEARVDGIALGTKRKTSGYLRHKPVKKDGDEKDKGCGEKN